MTLRGALAAAACLLAAPAWASNLVARVEPVWSPYVTAPVLKGSDGAELVAEARGLLAKEPAKVAEILGRQPPAKGSPAARIVLGLRADALYQSGTAGLLDAQRLYREVVTSPVPPDEEAWAHFMLGNIRKIQGYTKESEVAYRAALKGASGPWRAAAVFSLGALFLESGRTKEARATFQEWLSQFGSEPGRALVLHLLAECEAKLGESEDAGKRLAEARALDPNAWLVRPQTGYVLADLFRRSGNLEEAVRTLDAIPRAHPGTLDGAKAHLAVGGLREADGNVEAAARAYGQLLDEGATPEEGKEALLRLALLGAEFKDRVRLRDSYPAYKTFYRPAPALEEAAKEKDPARVQRALRGLALLAQREGRVRDALRDYAKAFQEGPKGPEAARAYDGFMECLESYLADRLQAGAPMDVVSTYEAFRGPVDWSADRDKGRVALRVAEAYQALGAPRLAREVYERVQRDGTRAVERAQLDARVTETRAREGDPDAVRSVAARRPAGPKDPGAEIALARKLSREGRPVEARDHFLRAADLAQDPATKVALMAEADLLSDSLGRVDEHLKGLGRRAPVVGSLPAGKEKAAWEASTALSEARLRYSQGDYAGAVQAYGRVAPLGPEDTYVLALSEKRLGHEAKARELFGGLAKGKDPVMASLAAFYLKAADTEGAARGKR